MLFSASGEANENPILVVLLMGVSGDFAASGCAKATAGLGDVAASVIDSAAAMRQPVTGNLGREAEGPWTETALVLRNMR
mmetsp:Transcript_62920/g.137860  ORF Transcript_62920/g.137860 Transcript_62920/m.137860 type:complete len:80 (+) Transcript_62920:310-549(+)